MDAEEGLLGWKENKVTKKGKKNGERLRECEKAETIMENGESLTRRK